jgi:mono/diheme cytochrome c family protein
MNRHIMAARRRGAPPRVAALLVGLTLLALMLTSCDVSGGSSSVTTPGAATPPAVPTTLMRGEELFARYCQVCHPGGNAGVGARLIGLPLSDDQAKSVIRHGQKNMPAFTTETIPDTDLQSLVDYIRSLK